MQMSRRLGGLFLAAVILTGAVWCQEPLRSGAFPPGDLEQRVRAYVAPLVDNRDFSGVIRIVRGDQLLFEESWGFADFESRRPHSPESRFAVASVSKTLTAAAVIRLRAAGRLSYEDPVGHYLPGFAHGHKIKVRHLLRFESGLKEIDSEKRFTGRELLAELAAQPLEFEPGTRSRYGNSGFNLLASLVEAVTQMPFGDHLRAAFFEPLHMTGSGLIRDLERPERQLVAPHVPGPPPGLVFRGVYSNPSLALGAGGLYSTARDMTAWGLAMARKEIIDIGKEEYPWGWGKTTIEGHSGITQTGMQTGFTSSLQVFPEERIVIAMLNNVEAGLWVDWAKDLARMVFSAEPQLRHERYDYLRSPSEEMLESLPGRYQLRPDRFVVIRAVDGQLWSHLNDHHVGRYLLPLADGGFQLRDFTGRILANRGNDEGIRSLTWKLPASWNAADETYFRVP